MQPGADQCPSGYIYWENDKKIYHVISIWLKSCLEIRKKGKFLWASKLAINHFIGRIALQADECQFQVINAVDILSIHCTGILAMLAHIRGLQKYPTPCTVPRVLQKQCTYFQFDEFMDKGRLASLIGMC